MNTAELIQQEAERRYPMDSEEDMFMLNRQHRFIRAATFGASLNGWVKITPETMPTKDDVDLFEYVEVWNILGGYSERISYLRLCQLFAINYETHTHWRKIVKP